MIKKQRRYEHLAALGLLRLNDKKSRHRSIKKQRRYERLAALGLSASEEPTSKHQRATSLSPLGCHKPVIPVVSFLTPLAEQLSNLKDR